jgi:hypothetical protein
MDITGLISFSNVMFVISSLMIVLACIWLFGIYFVAIIALIPLNIIEILLYLFFLTSIYNAPQLFGNLAYIWGLLFAFGLTVATFITTSKNNSPTGDLLVFNLLNILVYGITGIYINSTLICTFAVMFFMSFIVLYSGFGRSFASITMASGITTAIGTFIRINSNAATLTPFMKNAELFVPGMLWFGPFVFFISLLIMSSIYYVRYTHTGYRAGDSRQKYLRAYINNNMITLMCILCAVCVGNLYDISQLSGISGTIGFLFLLEKYVDLMPNRIAAHAWGVLIIGILTYVGNMYYRIEFEKYGLANYFHLVPPIYSVQ